MALYNILYCQTVLTKLINLYNIDNTETGQPADTRKDNQPIL